MGAHGRQAVVSSARITVCVPTIGRMEYLPKTQSSLRAQKVKDVDVVILDNGSGAEAQAFVDQWAASDRNVRVIRNDPRIPMLENFNLGIRAAKTEYVTFFHDDDEYRPDFIEKLVALLDANPSAGLAGSNVDFIDEDGNLTEQRRWVAHDVLLSRREYVQRLIERGRNLIQMPGLVFRREILGDGFDTSLPIYYGDFIMLMRYSEQSDIAILAEPVMRVRRHAKQASTMVPLSRGIPIRTRLLLGYLDEYGQRYPEDKDMVRRLRRRVTLAHRVALVWGWASAKSLDESQACVSSLRQTPVGAALSLSLGGAAALGLRPHRVTSRGLSLVRQLAERLRF